MKLLLYLQLIGALFQSSYAKDEPTTVQQTTKLRSFEKACLAFNDRLYAKCNPPAFAVNSTTAAPHEFPHLALLGSEDKATKNITWFCAGTLISEKYVLTAAHCFLGEDLPNRIRLGELDYATDTDVAKPQNFLLQTYYIHPDYDFQKNYNDIALIELNSVAELNQYVAPACLAASNGTTAYTDFTAAGWGAMKNFESGTSRLKKISLKHFDNAKCKEFYNSTTQLDHGLDISSQLCAEPGINLSDTCTGDGGGPLFVKHPQFVCMYQIIGITSFGSACGIKGIPSIYTNVSAYTNWIESIVWN